MHDMPLVRLKAQEYIMRTQNISSMLSAQFFQRHLPYCAIDSRNFFHPDGAGPKVSI